MMNLLKTGLKTTMVLMVLFSTISPVYANIIILPLKNFLSHSQLSSHVAHEMPCHGVSIKKTANKNLQELCFRHCLQYLNEPCVLPSKTNLELAQNHHKPAKTIHVIMPRSPENKFEVLSLSDPPKTMLWVQSGKGLPQTLLLTSRLRN